MMEGPSMTPPPKKRGVGHKGPIMAILKNFKTFFDALDKEYTLKEFGEPKY